jgi:microcompartment protein CcmK/EutM
VFLGTVLGSVVMTRKDASLEGACFRVVLPQNHNGSAMGTRLVALDVVGARNGDAVYLVKGREASIPWMNPVCPVDACIVGIVDGTQVEAGVDTRVQVSQP